MNWPFGKLCPAAISPILLQMTVLSLAPALLLQRVEGGVEGTPGWRGASGWRPGKAKQKAGHCIKEGLPTKELRIDSF